MAQPQKETNLVDNITTTTTTVTDVTKSQSFNIHHDQPSSSVLVDNKNDPDCGSIKMESSTISGDVCTSSSSSSSRQQSDSKAINDDKHMDGGIVLVDQDRTLESSCSKRKPSPDNDNDGTDNQQQISKANSSSSNKRIKIENDYDETIMSTSISSNNFAEIGIKIGCDNNNDDKNIDVQRDSPSTFEIDDNKIIDNNSNNDEVNDAQILDYYEKLLDDMEQEWLEEMKEYYYMVNNVGIYIDYPTMKKRLDPIGLAKQLVYICESYDDDDHSRPCAHRLLTKLNPQLFYDDILEMIQHLTATTVSSAMITITPPLTPSTVGSTDAGKCHTSTNIISTSGVNEPPSSSMSTTTSIKSEPIHQSSIVSTMTLINSSGKNQSNSTVSSSLPLLDDNSQVASPKSISNINDMSNTIINEPNLNNTTTIANDITDSSNIKTSLAVAKKLSISSSLDNESSTEQMVERAKKEAYVMKRIAELRKNGVWSIRRLPKVHEPPRCKTHWDYLLEEMQWLAADFFQERKWKRNSAKKCARLSLKYHASKECQAERIEREEQSKLKRIASNMSKMIKQFWAEIEKVVEAKQEVQLNEKRKKIHDMQLRFIVDKADLLTEKLAQELIVPHKTSKASSTCSEADPSESGVTKIDSSIHKQSKNEKRSDIDDQDVEFEQGSICSDDDEETIAKEEKDCQQADYADEINALSNESEMPIEQLLAKYYNIDADDIDLSQLQKQHQKTEEKLDDKHGQQKDDDMTTVDDETENNDDDDLETADSEDETSAMKKQQDDDDESMISEIDNNQPEEEADTDDSDEDSDFDENDNVDSSFLIQPDDKKVCLNSTIFLSLIKF